MPAPWIAQLALDLGLHGEDVVRAALERQASEPGRPIDEFLDFDEQARQRFLDHFAARRPELARALEVDVFQRWAERESVLGAAGLKEARALLLAEVDADLWSLLQEHGLLDPELTPPGGRHFRCAACQLELRLAVALQELLTACPACGSHELRGRSGQHRRPTLRLADARLALTEDTPTATAELVQAAPSPQPTESLPGDLRVGGYHLVARLGQGGMGEVFLARNRRGEQVALKVLNRGLQDDVSRRRFEREGAMLEALRHPNVVSLLERGLDEDGTPFLALEFVEGRDLQSHLRERQGPLPLQEAVLILHRCARALAHAHGEGVIHRDVKPGNVLLTSKGEVKLSDFGISLSDEVSARLTKPGEVLGTPYYLCPEVLDGEAWTPAADVYALGAMAFRLLSGRHMFRGRGVIEVLAAHMDDQPPRLSDVTPEVPAALSDLVWEMVAKLPSRRPGIEAVRAEFAAALTGEPIDTASWVKGSPGSPQEAEDTQIAARRFGCFLPLEELGRGGRGVAYKATHLGLGRAVVLYVFPTPPEGPAPFLEQASCLQELAHEHVVPVLSCGAADGEQYLVAEYVAGRPLLEVTDLQRDPREALRLFLQVCRAVSAAHEAGVVHGELRPSHVLVSKGAARVLYAPAAARLCASGLERLLATQGSVARRLRYAPPELREEQSPSGLDPRSDVYGLGAVLYRLVCGRPPRDGTVVELRAAEGEVPLPSSVRESVPRELDGICRRCLRERPEDRFPSVPALVEELEVFLERLHQPRGPTFADRVRRWILSGWRRS